MSYVPYNRSWENWATVVARLFLAVQFGIAAFFKIMFFSGEVAQTAAVGVPLPLVSVSLALVLEVAAVISLITGWYLRIVAAILSPYVALLAVLFYHNWSDPNAMGSFFSHFGLIAALLYVSVFGAKFLSVDKS